MKLRQKCKSFIIAHKVWSMVVAIILVIGGYFTFKPTASAEVRYVTTPVTKGTVVVSVSGTGQVSASNQVNLTAKVSGTITSVNVKAGQFVTKGHTLFSVDATAAQKAVRDAKTSLESAQLSLAKFQEAPTSVAVSTINNTILDAQNSKITATKSVADAYLKLLNSTIQAVPSDTVTIANYNYIPPTITGTYTKGIEGNIYISLYNTGNTSGFTASGLVNGSGAISTTTPQPIGDSGLFIQFPSTTITINTWVIHIPNINAPDYSANKTAYQNAEDSQTQTDRDADQTIAQQQQNLATLYQPDPIDLRTQQLAVQQKQDALTDAENALSDYYVTAPFDGVIASVAAQVGESASGTLGTIITNQKIASISLNEVDVSKIKLGEKATLTFDAIPDLSIAGTVASIDPVGTVSQGVVNYTVQLSLDTPDDRIKPGMSVSAAIISSTAQDVLIVPNSAVKSANGSSYVEVFDVPLAQAAVGTTGSPSAIPPRQQPVEVGLSNGTSTEITSGLNEGDIVVSRTITTTTKTTTTTAPSLLGGTAARGAGGGAGAFRGAATGR